MFLFSRACALSSAAGVDWATTIFKRVNEVFEGKVNLWSRAYSGDLGVVVFTSWWDDLSTLEAAMQTLNSDAAYQALAIEGANHLVGRATDTLAQLVHGDHAVGVDAKWASVVTAVCANGSLADGITNGVEIAQRAEQSNGVATMFLAGVTGAYGGVSWIAGYGSIGDFEAAQTKLNSDTSFVKFVDKTTHCYVQEPLHTQSTLYRRLG